MKTILLSEEEVLEIYRIMMRAGSKSVILIRTGSMAEGYHWDIQTAITESTAKTT
jgi:hypothetical protein